MAAADSGALLAAAMAAMQNATLADPVTAATTTTTEQDTAAAAALAAAHAQAQAAAAARKGGEWEGKLIVHPVTGADGQMVQTDAVDDFSKMGLSEPLLKAVFEAKKFEKPSKIQSLAVPMIITPPFYNLVGQAKTVGLVGLGWVGE